MSVISDLVSYVGSVKDKFTHTRKSDLLDYFSVEEQMLNVFLSSMDSSYADLLANKIKTQSTDEQVKDAQKAYALYLSSLSPRYVQQEKRSPLSTIIHAVEVFQRNEHIVLNNYLTLFNQPGNDVSWENVRLTQILILSYFTRASEFTTWAFYLAMFLNPTEGVTIPPYRKDYLFAHAKESAEYADLTLSNEDVTIDKRIASIRKAGKDLMVYNDGVAMDQYVDDSILDDDTEATLSHAMRNPIAMFMAWKDSRRLLKIEQLRSRINWLRAKVTQHALDVEKADPDSEEYKKSSVLLQRYSDILSSYDQKLEREMR